MTHINPGTDTTINPVIINDTHRSKPHQQHIKFNSTELILLAHDEWKRREERKHNHNEQDWVAGFLSGFCTSRRWAREYVDKLQQGGVSKV